MFIYNMETQRRTAWGPSSVVIWDIYQPPLDTFAIVSLTKTRGGDHKAGGFSGIVSCDGDDVSDEWYPPAYFRRRMRHIQVAVLSEGQYAECQIALLREA